jgi:1-acyl-sn-glycerol-3-phosphate acyltransferase
MIRVISIVLALILLTLVLLPLQLIGIAFDLRLRRTIPHLYHLVLCALIGVRIFEVGRRSSASPALILSNHVSWVDISVITALAPVVFVAKSEVAGWPVFGWLARLQQTIFISRRARHQIGAATREIAGRLLSGDVVVLFAEGTSSDGTPVLPFRSSLVGAVHHALGSATHHTHVTVQPMSLAYVGSVACRWAGAWRARGVVRRRRPGPSSASRTVVGSRRRYRELGRGHRLRHERRSQGDCARRRKIGAPHDRGSDRPSRTAACRAALSASRASHTAQVQTNRSAFMRRI